MTVQASIETKLNAQFNPTHLEVVNESNMHNVPPGSESHFKVVLVSDEFGSKTLLNRHRMVNKTLAEELRGSVHALALHTMTPDEWFEKAGKSVDSPECLGGSKNP
jgi:BolA protein